MKVKIDNNIKINIFKWKSVQNSPRHSSYLAMRGIYVIALSLIVNMTLGFFSFKFATQLVKLEFSKVCVMHGGIDCLRSTGLLTVSSPDLWPTFYFLFQPEFAKIMKIFNYEFKEIIIISSWIICDYCIKIRVPFGAWILLLNIYFA